MNKLVSFKKFSKNAAKLSLSEASVIVDKNNTPLGFVFGRDSFISFLEHIDSEFEKRIEDPKVAFNNPAGRLIDMIEEKLPLHPEFMKDLKQSARSAKIKDSVSLEELSRYLNV